MTPALKLIADTSLGPAPAADFLDAMCAHADGVVLVTCWVRGRPWGMTVTSFASVSAAPPTIMVSLASGSTAARALAAAGLLGVSVLSEEQVDLARYGSEPGAPKFLERFTAPARSATPIVAGALAHLDCEVTESVPIFDHTVLFARVRATHPGRGGAPLVYHRRGYRAVADSLTNERNAECLSS